MIIDIIPLCYRYARIASIHAEAYARSVDSLTAIQTESEKTKRAAMLPAVRARAEAELLVNEERAQKAKDIAADLCKAYIFRAIRAAAKWRNSDQAAERYAAAVTSNIVADICKSTNIAPPGGSITVGKPETADLVQAHKVIIKSVWLQEEIFEGEQIDEENIIDEVDISIHSAELTAIAAGICPYNYEAAATLEETVMSYLSSHDLLMKFCEVVAEYEESPTAVAGAPLSNAVVGCRAADMLIRHRLTGEQQAIILEVLARMPKPKKDIKTITADTPYIIVPLTDQEVSTITDSVYKRNNQNYRNKFYDALQVISEIEGYNYIDAEGNVIHRKGQLLHTVVETYKETGAFKGMAVHLCPAFGTLVKTKYWTAYLQEYHRQRIAANGDEFSSLYMAVMAHFDAIQQAAAHGKRMTVEVSFAQVFGPRPDKSNRGEYVGYTRRINRAEAAAQTVANTVGATSFEIKKHAGERIGIAFIFTPPEVETAELTARVKAIEQKITADKPGPKRGRGRPRKS